MYEISNTTISYLRKVYLAGGFHSNWQEKVISALKNQFIFFNPRNHGLDNSKQHFTWNIHCIKDCDILFAYVEANNLAYDMMFEIGVAYTLGKIIIIVDEKLITDISFSKYLSIVLNVVSVIFDNLDDGINFLEKFSEYK